MKRTAGRALSALIVASLLTGCGLAPEKETTRSLHAEMILPEGASFEIDNLAGAIQVGPGDGDAVVIEATVHAGSADLASTIRLEESEGEAGARVMTVKFPLDQHGAYLYPGEGGDESEWLKLLGPGSNVGSTYDGQRVKVSSGSGVLLYVDLEIRLPRRGVSGTVSTLAGDVEGNGFSGRVRLESSSGQVRIEGARGEISAKAISGDISASRVEGSFSATTSGGAIRLDGFEGEAIECSTASGDIELDHLDAENVKATAASGSIRITGKNARNIKARTASGDIAAQAGVVEVFDVGTASGAVQLFAPGRHLKVVDIGTASGDVEIGMGEEAGFDLRLHVPDTDAEIRYPDAEKIVEDGRVVGYRRGNGRIQIKIDVRHGHLVVGPETGSLPGTGT